MKADQVYAACKLNFLLLKKYFVKYKLLFIIGLCRHFIRLQESERIVELNHILILQNFIVFSMIHKMLGAGDVHNCFD